MPSTAMIVAVAIYLLISAIVLLFALRYLFSTRFMPYHSIAVGKKWEELDLRLQATIRAMLTVVGGGMLAGGLTGILLSLLMLKSEYKVLVWIIPFLYLVHGIPTLYATVTLKRLTGAPTPVVPSVISVVLTILAFAISLI